MYDLIPYSPVYCDLSILVDSEKDTGNSHLHINSFSISRSKLREYIVLEIQFRSVN